MKFTKRTYRAATERQYRRFQAAAREVQLATEIPLGLGLTTNASLSGLRLRRASDVIDRIADRAKREGVKL